MEKLIVSLEKHSYPIMIANGLLDDPLAFWPLERDQNAMLVTNDRIASLYLDSICKQLIQIGIKVDYIILPDGEQYKSLEILERIFTILLQKGHGRDTTLIAIGGGVIGDLTGFAASSYQRGVNFMQIPTTLLSQVDASIGGKTAINHPLGKNMIGSFYQPKSVLIDLNCLKTLPNREFSSGLAEIIKYGVILDNILFSWLENNLDLLLELDMQALAWCIHRCCELKSRIIVKDEYERKGLRALLNFGHTYGHAIEVYMGYGNWLHGEAISAGMMMAIHTSCRLGQFSDINANRVKTLLLRANLPIKGPDMMSPDAYLPYMIRDKKTTSGKQLNLVLPLGLGCAEIRFDIKYDIVLKSIKDCQT